MTFHNSDNKIYFVFILSFILGCIIKVYDEIVDNKLNVSISFIESIKIFMIGITTILFLFENSFIFPFLFGLCYNLYLGDMILIKYTNTPIEETAINDTYWNSSIIYVTVLAVFIFFYNYKPYFFTFKSFIHFLFSKNKYIFSGIYIAFTFFSYLWESYYFTEENSSKKYYWRIIFVLYSIITCILFIVYKKYFILGLPMLKIWHIGYLVVWFCFKFFIRKTNNTEVVREKREKKKHKKNKKIAKKNKKKSVTL
jgi:xanthine/uracil permease